MTTSNRRGSMLPEGSARCGAAHSGAGFRSARPSGSHARLFAPRAALSCSLVVPLVSLPIPNPFALSPPHLIPFPFRFLRFHDLGPEPYLVEGNSYPQLRAPS